MDTQEKKDTWDITVEQRRAITVSFEDDVTEAEATRRLLCDDYEDILDERDDDILRVISAK